MKRGKLLLLPLLAVAPAASGDDLPAGDTRAAPLARYELVRGKATASAALPGDGPSHVLDENLASAWCTAPSAPGQLLTIELARAVPVDRVVVTLGIMDDREEIQHRPGPLAIALDDGELQLVRPEDPQAERLVLEAPGTPVQKITLRLVEPGGGRACISGISLERARHPHSIVQRLDDRQLEALRAALVRLRDAVATCDARGLGALATFPLAFKIEDERGRRVSRRVRNLAELLDVCKPAPFTDRSVHELRPDTVSVWADGDWLLRWRRGSGWRLVGLPDEYGQP
jgi:hypothetical protein